MNDVVDDGIEELVEAATEVVQEIVRVFKTRRLYASEHPKRLEIEEHSIGRIRTLVDAVGPIPVKIEEDTLSVEDHVVYEHETGRDSLAFIMFREGLRDLVLHPGIEADEITGLLDEVSISATVLEEEEGEQDLVARLWERDFVHVRYYFVEMLSEEEWIPPSADEEDEEEPEPIELAEEDRSAVEKPEILEGFDSTLYLLDDEDMAALQAQLESERGSVLLRRGLTMIRELLVDPVRDDPAPILDTVRDVQEGLIRDADFDGVRELHETFDPLLEPESVDPRIRDAFAELRSAVLGEETLDRLRRQLESGVVSDESAGAFYRRFGREDLLSLLRGVGDLKRLCQRPPVADAFLAIAREHPYAIGEALRSEPTTAIRAAHLALLSGDARLLEALGVALDSEHAEVRREALMALKSFGGGRALEYASRAIADPDPTIRLYALRHLVGRRYAPALPRVRALIEADDLADRPLTERRLIFEAYGALGGPGVVDELTSRLGRRRLFRKPDPETVACALVGLGATEDPEARKLVEDRLDSSQTLVRRTAEQVLESWGIFGRTSS